MKRFFGAMPTSEVKQQEIYRETGSGDEFMIQAGPKGYSIIWSDGSSTWEDIDATTKENFQAALNEVLHTIAGFECITAERTVVNIM